MNLARLVERLGLEPLPVEGGLFAETYRSAEAVAAAALPARYGGDRVHGTAIYYLLTDEPGSFSALHRLRSDELYHFYLGDPVDLLLLHPDGSSERRLLGPDVLAGQDVQSVVPRGTWQGSRLADGGSFALLGATMAPGWDAADCEHGRREELVARYPEQAATIADLTRELAADP